MAATRPHAAEGSHRSRRFAEGQAGAAARHRRSAVARRDVRGVEQCGGSQGPRSHAENLLAEAKQQAARQGVEAETVVSESFSGRAADSICEACKANGCDLVVMGTHGRKGLGRMVLGSDAASGGARQPRSGAARAPRNRRVDGDSESGWHRRGRSMQVGLMLAAALAAAAVPSAARGTPNALGMAADDPSRPSGATPHHMAPRAGSSAASPDTALMRLRAARNGEPVWLDVDGRPGPNAADAVALLGNASAEGLDPEDYGADALGKRMRALASGAAEEADATAWDLELSRSVLRYLRDLHVGRVDPRRLGFRVGARTSDPDFAALLLDALDRRRLRALAEELAPPLSQYRVLRKRLAEYRSLAEQGFEPLTVPAAPRAARRAVCRCRGARAQARRARRHDRQVGRPSGRCALLRRSARTRRATLSAPPRSGRRRCARQVDAGRAQRAAGTARAPDRACARAHALAAAAVRPALGCGQHPDVPTMGLGRRQRRRDGAQDDGRDRRPRAGHPDAGVRRRHDAPDLPAVLECAGVDRPQRDPARAGARSVVSAAPRHGDRRGSRRRRRARGSRRRQSRAAAAGRRCDCARGRDRTTRSGS